MLELIIWIVAVAIFACCGSLMLHWRDSRTTEDVLNDSLAQLSVERRKPFRRLARVLHSLDIRLQPVAFIGGVLLASMAMMVLLSSLFPERPLLALCGGLACLPLFWMLLRDLVEWRARRFEEALVDIVDLMQAAAAGGASPLKSLQVAAESSRGSVREAIAGVAQRLRLGASVEMASKPLIQRYPSEGVRLFSNTLTSRWHAGGDFQQLLAALGGILRERRFFRQQLRGQLSGARYALLFAGFFPYVLIPFFLWKEPNWLLPLSEHPLGPTLVLSALGCQIIGLLWMRRILRSDE